jgi:hypothetical protein
VFPGDPDFHKDNYWQLPFHYVILAIRQANKIIKREAHYAERPIAQLAAIQLNKTPSKSKKRYSLTDMCLYTSADDLNLPKARYGAAMLEARRLGIYPSWCLFIYKELLESASGGSPDPCIYISEEEDVAVLAPSVDGTHLSGLVILQESASNQIRRLYGPDNKSFWVLIPAVNSKLVADEDMLLTIIRSENNT